MSNEEKIAQTENDNVINDNENVSENQDTKQNFDYRKEREERIKNKAERAICNELGVKSIDEIKNALNSINGYKNQISELEKQVSEGKINQYKVQVLKAGIDEEFVDYVVDSLQKQVTEKEDFKTLLDKFKSEHPRYLRQSEYKQIKVNTSSNFESANKSKNFSEQFNDIIRRKIIKER